MGKMYFRFRKKDTPRVEKILSRTDVSYMDLVTLFKESMKKYKTPNARLNWIEKQLLKKETS